MNRLVGLPSFLRTMVQHVPDGEASLNPGDVWVLSSNSEFLGLAMVAAVKQSFVLAWPVTLPNEPAYPPALQAGSWPSGEELWVWPTRETGLSTHLLHSPLGRALSPNKIKPVALALDDGDDPGLPLAKGQRDEQHDAQMLEKWQALCFITCPADPLHILDHTAFQDAGGSSQLATQVLGLPPAILLPLWRGNTAISEDQATALAMAVGTEPEAIIGPDPLQPALDRLAHPMFKRQLIDAASATGLTEDQTRLAVRSEYALAARDDTLSVSDDRLRAAIDRVAKRQNDA